MAPDRRWRSDPISEKVALLHPSCKCVLQYMRSVTSTQPSASERPFLLLRLLRDACARLGNVIFHRKYSRASCACRWRFFFAISLTSGHFSYYVKVCVCGLA